LSIMDRNILLYPKEGKNLVEPMFCVLHHQFHWINEELLWREQIEIGFKH